MDAVRKCLVEVSLKLKTVDYFNLGQIVTICQEQMWCHFLECLDVNLYFIKFGETLEKEHGRGRWLGVYGGDTYIGENLQSKSNV